MIQVLDSIPWVRCASGNVLLTQCQVANKMEREVKKVKLYRQADFGPGLEVPATSTAVNFGGSRLYAEVV